ncbi:MAG: cyclic pyranopterin monophosphate synthase MoaC [archaeon]
MIDVSRKPDTSRRATAFGKLRLTESTIRRLQSGRVEKGDPFCVAEIAGIMAAKNTSQIIPLCHPLPITSVQFTPKIENNGVAVHGEVKTVAKTGVEMEALTAVAAYLLTIWDMTKMYEKDATGQYPRAMIENIRVVRKENETARRRVNKGA